MKILVSTVGLLDRPDLVWPEGWPIPEVGSEVSYDEDTSLFVRTVVWYLNGDEDTKEPFVYIVLGPKPREGF